MFKQSKEFGVLYPGIERLRKTLIANAGTGKKCSEKVVIETDGLLTELVVNSIYDCVVVFEVPNGYGGLRYLRMAYHDVEYPKYSMAARSIAYNAAQTLFHIEDKWSASRKEKVEAQRREYVLDHWQDHYDGLVIAQRKFYGRQEEPAPYYLDEAALEAAIRQQCAVTFCGAKAICACAQTGSMEPCQFVTHRLRETIKAYLKNVGKPLVPSSKWTSQMDKLRSRERLRD